MSFWLYCLIVNKNCFLLKRFQFLFIPNLQLSVIMRGSLCFLRIFSNFIQFTFQIHTSHNSPNQPNGRCCLDMVPVFGIMLSNGVGREITSMYRKCASKSICIVCEGTYSNICTVCSESVIVSTVLSVQFVQEVW